MSTVVMHAVVSVDGFVADAGDDVGPLFEWYPNGDAEIVDGQPFAATEASLGYVRPMPLSTSPAPWLTSAAADGGVVPSEREDTDTEAHGVHAQTAGATARPTGR